MLLAFKDDNTTGSLYLCHLFYVLRVIMLSDYICTRVHLCTVVCKDGTIWNMCMFTFGSYLCGMLFAGHI